MAIQKLEAATVRTIGASQTLTDPGSVVKELLDNALDARATSVSIEIANNTLDTIQVRDNGHGIPSEDRSMVAMPHCTSKISSEDDLRSVGGTWLGFRGEALASVAEMSGSLTISTRVEGEQVASVLKISRTGEVTSQERASLPVGTTIKITDFIRSHPVRRQVALKNTDSCLKKIKQMLQAYAFARPHVRMSLKVLKAKSDKVNWTYAPKLNATIQDAACKIIGIVCTNQCEQFIVEEDGVTIAAFLPRHDADANKISGAGNFISIDARPVNSTRGAPKQIIKAYREAIKISSSSFENVKDPFLQMEITCSSVNYDPNIEPAKDDVLFEDPAAIVSTARKLFAAAYPKNYPSNQTDETTHETQIPNNSDVPMGRQSGSTEQPSISCEEDAWERQGAPVARMRNAFAVAHPQMIETPRFRANMYGCDEEDMQLIDERPATGRTETDREELRKSHKDVTASNPWVFAKMNAPQKRTPQTIDTDDLQNCETNRLDNADVELSCLPTPRPSSPTRMFHPSDHVPDVRLARDGRLMEQERLSSPQLYTPMPSSLKLTVNDQSQVARPMPRSAEYNYNVTEPGLAGTPLHAIPEAPPRSQGQKRQQQGRLSKPYINPVTSQAPREKVWFDHLEEPTLSAPRGRRRGRAPLADGLVTQGELGDLIDQPRRLTPPLRNHDIREFVRPVNASDQNLVGAMAENRNYGFGRRSQPVGPADRQTASGEEETLLPANTLAPGARGFIPMNEIAAFEAHMVSMKDGPVPKRRRTKNSGPLEEISTNEIPTGEKENELPHPTDKIASKMRRKSSKGSRLARTKSARLPLERVPAGQGLQNIIHSISRPQIKAFMTANIDEYLPLFGWNEPSLQTYSAFDSVTEKVEQEEMTRKLHMLLTKEVSDGEMVQDLGELVRNVFAMRERSETVESVF